MGRVWALPLVFALLFAACAPSTASKFFDPKPDGAAAAPIPEAPGLDEARALSTRTDPLRCVERLPIPQIDNVTSAAWSPDGNHLAVTRIITIPSRKTITGYEEELRLDDLDLASGKVFEYPHEANRPAWSGSGTYFSFYDETAGVVAIAHGGKVVGQIATTIADTRWVGDQLLYWSNDSIRLWDAGGDREVSRVDHSFMPRYPYDDAYFSADGMRFLLTRYHQDGTAYRYVGETFTGQLGALTTAGTTYTEWSPIGQLLLVRSNDAIELRGPDGWDRVQPVAAFPGPVHGWAPNGKDLLVGSITPTVPVGTSFDKFAVWDGDRVSDIATLPNLLGARTFSPDSRFFAGTERTGNYAMQLAVFRCGPKTPPVDARADPVARARQQRIDADPRRFVRPVAGWISQFRQGAHTGVDIAAPIGSVITADDGGTVTFAGWHPYGGRAVCVAHGGGLESCFFHTSLAYVQVGQQVARGQPIAAIGLTGLTTGPHVHWEVTLNGQIVDPLSQ